jgi:hypothetical protein
MLSLLVCASDEIYTVGVVDISVKKRKIINAFFL